MAIKNILNNAGADTGLRLDTVTGIITGSPTAVGDTNLRFTASNTLGSDAQDLRLTVTSPQTGFYSVALDDWSTGVAVQRGVIPLNIDNGTVTVENTDLAAHYSSGISTWRSDISIIHGPTGEQFEFGAIMFRVNGGAADGTELVQILVGCKPHARWATYPFADTFNQATDVTHPAPFKLRIIGPAGELVKTIAMRDGLPINDPSLSQTASKYSLMPQSVTLPNNPFTTTAGSSIVRVNHPNHGLGTAGYITLVYFYNATAFNGVTAPILNSGRYVKVLDTNTYEYDYNDYTNPVKPTAGGAGGGATVLVEFPNGAEDSSSPPLRPHFNCANLIPWQNKRPKMSAVARQRIPQFAIDTFSASAGKQKYSQNAAIPMMAGGANGRQQSNGYNNIQFMFKWPGNNKVAPSNWPSACLDPHLTHNPNYYIQDTLVTGWGYEPGSISGHDWFTGPGGVRHDRWQLPTSVAYYLSDQTSRHLVDNAPVADVVEDFGMAYFNHSCHYLRNVKTFETILNDKASYESSSYYRAYYGGGPFNGDTAKTRSIDLVSMGNGDYDVGPFTIPAQSPQHPNRFYEKLNFGAPTGQARRVWNGWSLDDQHSHQQPGIWSYALGSPMHLVATRHLANAAQLATLGSANPTTYWRISPGLLGPNPPTGPTYGGGGFSRVTAYRWAKFVWMTLNSNTHASRAFGLSRSEIDALWASEFAAAKTGTVDAINNAVGTSPWARAMKNLGGNIEVRGIGSDYQITFQQSTIHYYIGQLFVVMKSTGVWNQLRSHPTYGANATAVLDYFFELLFRGTIDYMVDAGARFEFGSEDTKYSAGRFIGGAPVLTKGSHPSSTFTMGEIPATWGAVAATFPTEGLEGFFRIPDGNFAEKYSTMHLRRQWAHAVKDWFPEHPLTIANSARVNAAATQYDAAYTDWYLNRFGTLTATQLAGSYERSGADFVTLWLPAWRMRNPAEYTVYNVSNVSELQTAMDTINAGNGNATIYLADGTYDLTGATGSFLHYIQIAKPNITIKSRSGIRGAVILKGDGMKPYNGGIGFIFSVEAPSFTLEGVTCQEVGYHCVIVKCESGADNMVLRNCVFRDSFEMLVKGTADPNNAANYSDGGLIEGCLFEYTAGIGPNSYIGGIDIHKGKNWVIRNNVFKNIASPNVATPGYPESPYTAEHAVHFWRDGYNITIENNVIINCDRGIGLGLGLGGTNNVKGGRIVNNFIYHANIPAHVFADVGIAVEDSPNVDIIHNTIYMDHSYPRAIEYRFAGTTGGTIRNNLTNKAITSRDGGTATLSNNLTTATSSMFTNVASDTGYILASAVSGVVNAGVATNVGNDIVGTVRPTGPAPDLGCYERPV